MLFSLLFVQVDWDKIKDIGFVDKENTTRVMSNDKEYEFISITDAVSGEQFWNFGFMYLVHNKNIDIDLIFKSISFFCIFIFALLVLVEGHYIMLLFLINPLIIDLCFSQFRSAFAFSLLCLAFILGKKRPYLTILILIPAVFIHTSVLLIISIYFIMYIITNKFRNQKKKLIFFSCVIALVVSLILGPFRDAIFTYLNDRRAGLDYSHHSGFLFSIYWMILAVFFLIQRKDFYNNRVILTGIVLLFIYLINTLVLNIYGSRFLSLGFVCFLVAMSKFKRTDLIFITPLFIFFNLFYWISWI